MTPRDSLCDVIRTRIGGCASAANEPRDSQSANLHCWRQCGAVATKLIAAAHTIRSVVRNKIMADAVAGYGVEPVVVADVAMGEPSDRIFREGTSFERHADKVSRVAIDRLAPPASGIRSAVLCNTMIYGDARVLHNVQIPPLRAPSQGVGSGAIYRAPIESLVEYTHRRCHDTLSAVSQVHAC
jgi:hypothetical protein